MKLVIIKRDTPVINTGAISDSADTALDALSHLSRRLHESIEAISVCMVDPARSAAPTLCLEDLRDALEYIAGSIEEVSSETEGVYKIVERLNRLDDRFV